MASATLGATIRKSERVMLKIPIRVQGVDIRGDAFDETTYTLVVNRAGGLIAVSHQLQPETVIKITNLSRQVSCSFVVVMKASASLSGNPEWGVKCLEPDVEIWGVYFPARTEAPPQADLTHALLECGKCTSREMAALTAEQYRRLVAESCLPRRCLKCGVVRDWRFAATETVHGGVAPSLATFAASNVTPQSDQGGRQERSLAVKLPLGIRLPNGSEETSTTENISESSLCFACKLDLQVGDRLFLTMGLDPPRERCDIPARIVWRRPAECKGRAYYGARLEHEIDAMAPGAAYKVPVINEARREQFHS